jgi:hypothetical protein
MTSLPTVVDKDLIEDLSNVKDMVTTVPVEDPEEVPLSKEDACWKALATIVLARKPIVFVGVPIQFWPDIGFKTFDAMTWDRSPGIYKLVNPTFSELDLLVKTPTVVVLVRGSSGFLQKLAARQKVARSVALIQWGTLARLNDEFKSKLPSRAGLFDMQLRLPHADLTSLLHLDTLLAASNGEKGSETEGQNGEVDETVKVSPAEEASNAGPGGDEAKVQDKAE